MPLYNPDQFTITPSTSGAATPSSVDASTTSVNLLAATSARKGATIWNNSTANLYVELGATATTSAFTAKVGAGGYYEIPFTYTGVISGIWDAVNGKALIREFI
ncbi:hypothetical protein NIES4075_72270 [Tolypothrix sp. NIES-4075]|uniref:hypothetical protein n=1 Tax=Tolypothrix sp. NIES-4075 TaxID=2005459 RepID=UPI000B5CCBCF|nr:hypothetical protein [Tolypothrix sp. NIES-4075]GAX46206.1 hypothetical protein NIES4075_72270 [Tolypothrix sp. NIES-4075]